MDDGPPRIPRRLEPLRDAATRIVQDLETTHPGDWAVAVDDSFVMTVTWNGRAEEVQLVEFITEDDVPAEAMRPPYDNALLDGDADGYLASEVSEVLSAWGHQWPQCPRHRHWLGACGSEWFCDGPPAHSIVMGALSQVATDPGEGHVWGAVVESVSPIRSREWIDDDGARWRLRGDGQSMPIKRVEALLLDADVRVLLTHGLGTPADVASEDRSALWARIRPYLRGTIGRDADDYTDVVTGEFKGADGASLLIIDERC